MIKFDSMLKDPLLSCTAVDRSVMSHDYKNIWFDWELVMGIPALFREPVLLAWLTKKSRLFQLPSGSSDFLLLKLIYYQK